MKMTTPGNVFPHRLFKRIQRLQEKAEKKGGANEKWNEKLEKDMKQVEEQLKNIPQCGFSVPAQQCFGFAPRGRGLFRGGRGGLGGRQGRGGWAGAAPAWAAMMSGWTGEQQTPPNTSQEKKAETGEAEHQQEHQEFVKMAEEAARQAHAQAHSAAQAAGAAGLLSGSEDYLQNVGSFVAAALDPLGIDVKIDIETPEGRKSCHVSRQTSTSTSAGQEQEKEKKEETKEEEKEKDV